ncbi:DUF1801 domain-containing protein [Zeaxanthinibacter sp. PT1]|uniref:DUF1801 domain-containing protein n=1 Tax=Zeaxanthinibacter TaxID=561554 RepID=UPI00234B693F|nr:DUF1801 domain-containing protein [Zeaxanthinibacter sp. PT1]MDC6350117.1 DUF1801 domain-containing protein [Zeaxanthinibacter sp. PT1]
MNPLHVHTDPAVNAVFSNYPDKIRVQLLALRDLVIETAKETEGIEELIETLKWGEPSYIAKGGSTLRMDWKPKKPDQYALYFKCTSRLVETFRKVFGNRLTYEKNRVIVLHLDEDLPVKELKQCIRATLIYHGVKQLPDLGIDY